jgi:ketosteroid isomerase-like protein
MSQENVQLVREGFARWNRGDYDFFLDSAAPDVELFSRFATLTGKPYRGHAGVREWLAEIQHSFERFELWLDEVRDLGDEVLVIGGIDLRARGSGIDMRERMGWVLEFRDGRVARMRFYAKPDDALEAVRLREWPHWPTSSSRRGSGGSLALRPRRFVSKSKWCASVCQRMRVFSGGPSRRRRSSSGSG